LECWNAILIILFLPVTEYKNGGHQVEPKTHFFTTVERYHSCFADLDLGLGGLVFGLVLVLSPAQRSEFKTCFDERSRHNFAPFALVASAESQQNLNTSKATKAPHLVV
jgi:hypothetical protein